MLLLDKKAAGELNEKSAIKITDIPKIKKSSNHEEQWGSQLFLCTYYGIE